MARHRKHRATGVRSMVLSTFAAALVAGTGCEPSWYDFRIYDDLADQTWVGVSEAPDDIGTQRYGWNIASGGVSDSGASFLVAGEKPDGFGLVTIDPAGTIETVGLALSAVNTLDQPNAWADRPIMASSPDDNLVAVSMSNGGSPIEPTQATVALLDSRTAQPAGLFGLPGSDHIKDLAFAQTDVADSGQVNVVALRFDQLGIVPDTADPSAVVPTCVHGYSVPLSIEVGDLSATAPGQEIVLAAANGTNASQVMILSGSLVSDAAATAVDDPAPCFEAGVRDALLTLEAPDGEADFGSGMVIADFNNTGVLDLAIGASASGKVYVYTEVDIDAGPLPDPIVVDGPPGAIGFGNSLYAGDIYAADGADELIVSMPTASVGGQVTSGMVHVYDFGAGAFAAPIVLHDAQPEGDSLFGQGLAVVPFGPTSEILVVGSKTELFTYFTIHAATDDVRSGVTP